MFLIVESSLTMATKQKKEKEKRFAYLNWKLPTQLFIICNMHRRRIYHRRAPTQAHRGTEYRHALTPLSIQIRSEVRWEWEMPVFSLRCLQPSSIWWTVVYFWYQSYQLMAHIGIFTTSYVSRQTHTHTSHMFLWFFFFLLCLFLHSEFDVFACTHYFF